MSVSYSYFPLSALRSRFQGEVAENNQQGASAASVCKVTTVGQALPTFCRASVFRPDQSRWCSAIKVPSLLSRDLDHDTRLSGCSLCQSLAGILL